MKKHEIYVEITNEQERLRAIEILEKAGERVWWHPSAMEILGVKFRYLIIDGSGEWLISTRKRTHKITLEQLEEMLMPKSEMKKQTSVEWLIDYLTNIKELPFIRQNLNMNEQNILNDIIKQAKEMEKEQIMEAYNHGQNNGYMYRDGNGNIIQAEQYYKETFNP
jgi:hypothetical protein